MITIHNLKPLLTTLGFTKSAVGEYYTCHFDAVNCDVSVDFDNERIIYPEDKGFKVNEQQTVNFSDNENFVVLECVCRLLAKGYRPEHIELERRWKLGHDPKGGRADICVSNQQGTETLFIIECKTAGSEYNKELKNIKNDGGQLFSYWQQTPSAQWLVLYASDFTGGVLTYKSPTIHCIDDANLLKQAEKDKDMLTFERAKKNADVEGKFQVWVETYNRQMHEDVIFNDDTIAYKIGVRPLRKQDLRDFEPEDKIVNRFEEILRHNNVSDKENAFNRLVALFICKLVDEIKKEDYEEVDFQYKQGTDTYEDLQDRLQRLHKQGMEEFMKEEIFYVSNDYAERLFVQYTGSHRKEAIKSLKETIRCLKFYSNNDFAFKDVHNEELFYQNGKVVMEMVQLFEPYRIVYPNKHQFLGDLFEQLLAKGFKQNEGQFFTPTPITRFIWDALPLRSYISEHGLPRIIDYACGAGHFLTEAVEAVNTLREADLSDKGVNDWVRGHIVGIEKDYRLARVSKISLFMNGAGGGHIIFGDGLENYPEKDVRPNSFDILVANPPYAVSAFKSHLKLKNNSFRLLEKISNDGSEIETLFVERIAQLLKPQGLAAVVLPSSILSNTSNSYIAAREEILKNFQIKAIACFGSQTFGATGTNTVTLFLEKYNEPPRRANMVSDVVDGIIAGQSEEWTDNEVLCLYTAMQGIDKELYLRFVTQQLDMDEIKNDSYLKIYSDAYVPKIVKNATPEEEKAAHLQGLYNFALPIERDKLYYFTLVCEQQTLVITAPAENAAQKQFLGYHWSNRKGDEGIKIDNPGGLLYNDTDRSARGSLACAIRNSFIDSSVTTSLDESRQQYAKYYKFSELMDFSRVSFDKSIKTNILKEDKLQSVFPLKPLGEVCNIKIGGTPARNNPSYFNGNNLWVSIKEMNGKIIYDTKEKITDAGVQNSNVKLVKKGTTLLSFKLSIGKTAIAGTDLYTNEAIAALEPLTDEILDGYLFCIFNSRIINLTNVGNKAFGKSLNSKYLRESIMIPVPSRNIQQNIIDECTKVDEEYNTSRMAIETYCQKIAEIFDRLEVVKLSKLGGVKLSDNKIVTLMIGKRVVVKEMNEQGQYPVMSANVFEPFGFIDKLLITDFSKPSVVWGIDGDWQVNVIPAGQPFYPTDHCGVMRILSDDIHPRYMAHALEKAGSQLRFSRDYRASLDRIKSITITIPEREAQFKAMEEVKALELQIKVEQAKMSECSARKQALLDKYLNYL